jgi:hypothetical protein
MPAKLGVDRHAVGMEGTVRPTRIEVFQLLDPDGDIGIELAMEARFGNPTEPRDVAIGDPLTPQIEGLHAHLEVRIGIMDPPAAQHFDVSLTKHALRHLRTPHARVCLQRKMVPIVQYILLYP